MIELSNVSKIYKIGINNFYALNNLSLKINDGDFVAVTGASGSGKTTLLNIIGCLDTMSEGEYLLDRNDVTKMSDEKKAKLRNGKIGFVLQDFALIGKQTVKYNVMLPLLFSKVPNKELSDRTDMALEKVGIANQIFKKANQLSGGQKQRVAIARAIVNSPSIILADEPTGQLDSKTGIQIMEVLKSLNDDGITVIIVTHDANVASYAKRQIVLSDGKIVSQS